ncbi:hypothetical protein V6N13_023775 [Hibiscus sabdariffa]
MLTIFVNSWRAHSLPPPTSSFPSSLSLLSHAWVLRTFVFSFARLQIMAISDYTVLPLSKTDVSDSLSKVSKSFTNKRDNLVLTKSLNLKPPPTTVPGERGVMVEDEFVA